MTTALTGKTVRQNSFLRFVLLADAVGTMANGIAYLAIAPLLEDWFGLAPAVQYPAGVFLVLYAAAVFFTGIREPIRAGAVKLFVDVNLLWFAASLVLVFTGVLGTNAVGTTWVVLQAVAVAAVAGLQLAGLKRN
ncbi:hypothetical protein [Amycolatopsis nigrescens]|uniref:hypothetical protein n=1 Tax=Amycolatopsis nigrescens TaxID=381445 RepID=UPI0003813395|nr:hypothetical protein [Amycolatopsis nigrescens]